MARVTDQGVLLRVAAGPRLGFGHLVRAVSLCRALGVRPVVALRGGRAARATARRLGCSLVEAAPRQALRRCAPAVLVVDDPHAGLAEVWVRAARRLAIPVAAICDQGIGARDADLLIDGSPRAGRVHGSTQTLHGSRFMVLDPVFSQASRRRPRRGARVRVAVALGGGLHARYASEVATILEHTLGAGAVQVAPGFAARHCRRAAHRAGAAHARLLGTADVALVGGGIGLYEACCLGVPSVAVAVTPAQRPTVRAFAALGAVVDGGRLAPTTRPTARRKARQLATRVLRLLDDRPGQRQLAARARRVVDGRGGVRVATALRRLAAGSTARVGGAA